MLLTSANHHGAIKKIHLCGLLLMAEILHQLIGSLSHYLQGFTHPRWCRISAINSMSWVQLKLDVDWSVDFEFVLEDDENGLSAML